MRSIPSARTWPSLVSGSLRRQALVVEHVLEDAAEQSELPIRPASQPLPVTARVNAKTVDAKRYWAQRMSKLLVSVVV